MEKTSQENEVNKTTGGRKEPIPTDRGWYWNMNRRAKGEVWKGKTGEKRVS